VLPYLLRCQEVFEAAALLLLATAVLMVLVEGKFWALEECVPLAGVEVLYETVSGLDLLVGKESFSCNH